ncbi:MAG: YkgJ family cysteine cluster protein [Phycisphaerae bacterium]
MVAEARTNRQLIEKVAEIYDWLDSQIRESADSAGQCKACGKCCDFEGFDHRLFVTPPEIIYLATNMGTKSVKPMPTSQCPYNIDSKCSVYKYRFAGCRIFYCKANQDFQSELSESVLKRFKSLCTQFDIPYRYADLATALNRIKTCGKTAG